MLPSDNAIEPAWCSARFCVVNYDDWYGFVPGEMVDNVNDDAVRRLNILPGHVEQIESKAYFASAVSKVMKPRLLLKYTEQYYR